MLEAERSFTYLYVSYICNTKLLLKRIADRNGTLA